MELRLLVIRTSDIHKLAEFYAMLGLVSEHHQHDNSPFHYTAILGTTVIEIYPLAKGQIEPDKNLRLAFAANDFLERMEKIKAAGIPFEIRPTNTVLGYQCVLTDPDGRKVEFFKV